MKNSLIFLIIILLLSQSAFGQGLKTEDEAKALAESVMQDVAAGRVTQGLERLRLFNVYPKADFDAMMEKVEAQLPEIKERFGKSIGYDAVTVEKIGDSLRQFVYLQKFERHVMVWRFIFYKPHDQWLLNTFYFDDRVQMLFTY